MTQTLRTPTPASPGPGRRLLFLSLASEPLLTAPPVTTIGQRLASFAVYTGLDAIDTVASPIVAHPLPLYPATWPRGRRRWHGVTLQSMWHPLMWLPDRLATRRIVEFPGTGVQRPENDDEWSVRVMLECTASRFHDEVSGGWADMLASNGLSTDDPDDLDRLDRWVRGGNDRGLDLMAESDPFADPHDPDWAFEVVQSMIGNLRIISWATSAQGLLDALDDEATTVRSVAHMAAWMFADLRGSETAWWQDVASVVETVHQMENGAFADLTAAVIDRLEGIRDYAMPIAQELSRYEG